MAARNTRSAANSSAVAKKGEDKLPAEFMDELALAGEQHKETLTRDDMSIPFIQILQSLSPQCTKGKAEFIKGAEPSDLFNTVTQQIFKTRDEDDDPLVGMKVLPIAYKRSFIEWIPRSKGGGLVAEYTVEEGLSIPTKRNDQNVDIIQEGSPFGTPGNQLSDTHTHFCFQVHEDGTWEPVILTMASTQIKPSKDLNNLVSKMKLPDGRAAPRFFGIFSVTTQLRQNDQGSWYIWKFEKVDDVLNAGRMDMFREAKQFAEGVQAGEHKADHAKMAESGDANPSVDGGSDDGDAPF
jgi:hypothetical protein